MSTPFSQVSLIGQPSWGAVTVNSGNFYKVDVSGQASVLEVGYSEAGGSAGYGEEGYDPSSFIYPSTSTPNWTLETLK